MQILSQAAGGQSAGQVETRFWVSSVSFSLVPVVSVSVSQAAEGQPAGQPVQRSVSAPPGRSALLRRSRSPGRVRPSVLARLHPRQGGSQSARRHAVQQTGGEDTDTPG